MRSIRVPGRDRLAASVSALAICLSLAACGAGSGSRASGGSDVLVVVSAPVSTAPWIGRFARNGAELAARQINASGGVKYAGRRHDVRVEVLDNAGSPQTAAAQARHAVSEHAAVLITDGVGAAAVAGVTKPAGLPVFVVFDGGASVVDP